MDLIIALAMANKLQLSAEFQRFPRPAAAVGTQGRARVVAATGGIWGGPGLGGGSGWDLGTGWRRRLGSGEGPGLGGGGSWDLGRGQDWVAAAAPCRWAGRQWLPAHRLPLFGAGSGRS